MKPVRLSRVLRALRTSRARPPQFEVFGLLHRQTTRLLFVTLVLLSVICVMPVPSAGAPPDGAADAALRAATAEQPTILISQVFTGGGTTGAPYQNDFVELHNAGQTSVDLSGWSIRYIKEGYNTVYRIDIAGVIPPGGYYLASGKAGASCTLRPCGDPLPTVDASNPAVDLSISNGRLYLVTHREEMSIACEPKPGVVDIISYGSASCWEGESPAPAGSNTTALVRLASGCQDEDQNGTDFVVGAPAPHNSQSPAETCKATAVELSGAGAVRESDAGPWLGIVALLALTMTARFLLHRSVPAA